MRRALMKELKCKTLGADIRITVPLIKPFHVDDRLPTTDTQYTTIQAPFTLTTIYLFFAIVGNGRQLNLPHGNFNDCKWPPWTCESEKQAIIRQRKHFSEICILKNFGVHRRLGR